MISFQINEIFLAVFFRFSNILSSQVSRFKRGNFDFHGQARVRRRRAVFEANVMSTATKKTVFTRL